jgi:transcriptional regulator with XRE-family HTH domain
MANIHPLQKYMKKTGFSQADLSRMFDISESIISYYLNGKRNIGKRIALHVSKITGIPVIELIFPFGENQPGRNP